MRFGPFAVLAMNQWRLALKKEKKGIINSPRVTRAVFFGLLAKQCSLKYDL